MTDYDATAHITEEMKNPAIKAPVGILTGLGVTYILGFGLNIAWAVNCGTNWPDLLSTPTGLPAAQMFYNVLGKQGGVAFTVLAALICNFTGASCLQAQARTCFALCRGMQLSKRVYCRRDVAVFKILLSHLACHENACSFGMVECFLLRFARINRLGFIYSYHRHFQCRIIFLGIA